MKTIKKTVEESEKDMFIHILNKYGNNWKSSLNNGQLTTLSEMILDEIVEKFTIKTKQP